MQISILLLDKSVLNPLVASGLTRERAFKTIQLGVILGGVGPGLAVFTITRLHLCKFHGPCLALLTLSGVVLSHEV